MFRLIVAAAILAAIAGAFDAGSANTPGWDVVRTALVTASALDARSFATGFVTALVIATLQRISLTNLAAVRVAQFAWRGRRLLKLTILAAGLIAVLKYV